MNSLLEMRIYFCYFQKEDTLFVTYKSHMVFSAFDSSCSEEQWTANVQHPGTRSRSSSALLVRDTDELISLWYVFFWFWWEIHKDTGRTGKPSPPENWIIFVTYSYSQNDVSLTQKACSMQCESPWEAEEVSSLSKYMENSLQENLHKQCKLKTKSA